MLNASSNYLSASCDHLSFVDVLNLEFDPMRSSPKYAQIRDVGELNSEIVDNFFKRGGVPDISTTMQSILDGNWEISLEASDSYFYASFQVSASPEHSTDAIKIKCSGFSGVYMTLCKAIKLYEYSVSAEHQNLVFKNTRDPSCTVYTYKEDPEDPALVFQNRLGTLMDCHSYNLHIKRSGDKQYPFQFILNADYPAYDPSFIVKFKKIEL